MASSSTESDCPTFSFSGRLFHRDVSYSTPQEHVSISTPLIIGLSVGVAFCIVVLAGLLILVYYQYRKRRLSQQASDVEPQSGSGPLGAPPGSAEEASNTAEGIQTAPTQPETEQPGPAAPVPAQPRAGTLDKFLELFRWKKAFRQQRSRQQGTPVIGTDTELQEYQEKAIADRQAKEELDCFYSRYGYFEADRHRRQH